MDATVDDVAGVGDPEVDQQSERQVAVPASACPLSEANIRETTNGLELHDEVFDEQVGRECGD